MALTTEVSKISVIKIQPKLWQIVLKLKCVDNTIEVINEDFIARYRTGQSIDDIIGDLIVLMQHEIDKYKSEQVIFTNTGLDTAVTSIQSQLNG